MTDADHRDESGPVGSNGDLFLGAALALAAAFAYAWIPDGSFARVALAAPILLFVPGYLLLQALLVPRRPMRARAAHGLIAIGLSPGIVGILALSTALVPGGFRPGPIVGIVTIACLLMAGVAYQRRSRSDFVDPGASLASGPPPEASAQESAPTQPARALPETPGGSTGRPHEDRLA